MGKMIAAGASSHAYAFDSMDDWENRRKRTRGNYTKRYGTEPPEQPQVASESFENNRIRFGEIESGIRTIQQNFQEQKPDAIIIIGDDQDENFSEENLPQFSIYIGESVNYYDSHSKARGTQPCHAELAWDLLEKSAERGFELSYSKTLPKGELISHAHAPLIRMIDPEGTIPVVLVFVNAIHVPGPSPARCYQLGETLRSIIESREGSERIAVYASGGLSHFTAGYPWPYYKGDHTVGAICEEFDRKIVQLMREGKGKELMKLTSADLVANGEVEFRQWIILMGMLGEARPEFLHYHALYRALTGMAVGYWSLT
jgi:aromatic ring-opening dioxygenase catalytic subunit (LigB family)